MTLSIEKIFDLSRKFGNAYYILDSEQFERNYENLYKSFSDIYKSFNIAYSYKTNYIPKLCRIVNNKSGYAEVVSDMELEMAIRIGVEMGKVIWNGPIKNSSKVEGFLVAGGTINVDSIDELLLIKKIAEAHNDKKFNVGIRCNFNIGDGVISRFGIDTESEDFNYAVNIIKNTKNVVLIGLHCHFADRSINYWARRVDEMIKIIRRVNSIIGYMPKKIDLGGGIFGNMPDSLKRQFKDVIPTYEDYAKIVATKFAENFPSDGPELLIEPGTALVGDCIKFVGRVEMIKNVRGKIFATILGSQKNINMGGVNPPIERYSVSNGEEYENVDIVGYTCIESDVLYKGYNGKIAAGDYFVFSNCGSYSIVMKPPFILPNFPIIDLCNDREEVIKRSECFDDLFTTYNF